MRFNHLYRHSPAKTDFESGDIRLKLRHLRVGGAAGHITRVNRILRAASYIINSFKFTLMLRIIIYPHVARNPVDLLPRLTTFQIQTCIHPHKY
jgi:hypothetical protein